MEDLEDTPGLRKERGAFFTPPAIADYLAEWAVAGDANSKVLDPTCGEAVFLLAAGRKLRELGTSASCLENQLFGVDLHSRSLDMSNEALRAESLAARLIASDFFDISTPDQFGNIIPHVDAVIGNPPFIRYQNHKGAERAKARSAALRQGVRISGLASSWASLLLHSCGFLKPEGRLAMVLPAELLTVGYAEPIRMWLRQRFEQVHLVLFEQLQFSDASEKVVLVLAKGSGGCDAFSLYCLEDAADLSTIRPMENLSVTPAASGKWTDLLLPNRQRQLFKSVAFDHFTQLATYGNPELGTVTGSNDFFVISESIREEYGLVEGRDLQKICPPGTKHLRGLSFSTTDWKRSRDQGERVWLLNPSDNFDLSVGARRYVTMGERLGVQDAYKCAIRTPWWKPPAVSSPDFFFTYMSHRYPRILENSAKVTFVNSMHGIRLADGTPRVVKQGLPLIAMNSMTMLGAEVFGRSYGGGILKMEPREAAVLPVPSVEALTEAWASLASEKRKLSFQLANGSWTNVVKVVDEMLLMNTMRLSRADVADIRTAARGLRARRLGRKDVDENV